MCYIGSFPTSLDREPASLQNYAKTARHRGRSTPQLRNSQLPINSQRPTPKTLKVEQDRVPRSASARPYQTLFEIQIDRYQPRDGILRGSDGCKCFDWTFRSKPYSVIRLSDRHSRIYDAEAEIINPGLTWSALLAEPNNDSRPRYIQYQILTRPLYRHRYLTAVHLISAETTTVGPLNL